MGPICSGHAIAEFSHHAHLDPDCLNKLKKKWSAEWMQHSWTFLKDEKQLSVRLHPEKNREEASLKMHKYKMFYILYYFHKNNPI